MCWRAGCCAGGPGKSGEMRRQEPHAVQHWEMQSPAPGEEQPHTLLQAGDQMTGEQLCKKGPGGPAG